MTNDAKSVDLKVLSDAFAIDNQAFNDDLLNRKDIAERLTKYLDSWREGTVISIDAPWGEGKTWFGRNWAKQLTKDHKVIFIDAFEQDYIEDPFLLIAAEIMEAIKNEGAALVKKIKARTIDVMKAILPQALKTSINLTARIFTGSTDVSEECQEIVKALVQGVSDQSGVWIEHKLDSHEKEKRSLKHFKKVLREFTEKQVNPVIIFIDELDRCQPTFAVKLLERIKHFFDVPNLIFVLLLNRVQLEKAVKGVYGSETDATAYLSKFFSFSFTLPKHTPSVSFNVSYGPEIDTTTPLGRFMTYTPFMPKDAPAKPFNGNPYENYIFHLFKRYKFKNDQHLEMFAQSLYFMMVCFDLSLRDLGRSVDLYALAQPMHSYFLAYVISIKIKNPDLFMRLNKNSIDAHKEAKENTDALIQRADKNDASLNHYLRNLSALHEAHITEFKKFEENLKKIFDSSLRYRQSPEALFPALLRSIDLF